jgi:restriction endonuclease S subunit
MRIGEIAHIQAGYQFRGKVESDPDGNVAIIQIKDIEDRCRLNPDTIDRIAFDKPFEQYLVSRDDVLFLSRGHRQFAIAIEDDFADTIASGYFYILRLHTDRIRPAYLAWYINQPPFQNQLAPHTQGTHMPFVSQFAFQDLVVPIPPLGLQDRIAAIADLAQHEQSILAQLASKRAALIQSLTLAAAEDAPSPVGSNRH